MPWQLWHVLRDIKQASTPAVAAAKCFRGFLVIQTYVKLLVTLKYSISDLCNSREKAFLISFCATGSFFDMPLNHFIFLWTSEFFYCAWDVCFLRLWWTYRACDEKTHGYVMVRVFSLKWTKSIIQAVHFTHNTNDCITMMQKSGSLGFAFRSFSSLNYKMSVLYDMPLRSFQWSQM